MRFLRLDWIDRDGKLLILAGSVSSVAPVASSLGDTEASSGQAVLNFLVGGIGGVLVTLLVVIFAERIGRRRLLVLLTLTTAAAAVASVLTSNWFILLPFIAIGALSRGGSDIQSVHALQRATLASTAPPNRRTDLYAVYFIAEALAYLPLLLIFAPYLLFSALSGLNDTYVDVARAMASVLLLLIAALLYRRVSSAVEAPLEARRPMNPFKLPSRRVIFTLAGLFGLNTLATTMLFQSMFMYWSLEDGVGLVLTNLAALSLSGIISIPALWLAAKIANRFGLVKILALTQMSAALFFVVAAFIPVVGFIVLFRTLYVVLGQMGIPLRTSYMMGVVAPEERVAAAGIIFLMGGFLGWPGPVLAAFFSDIGQIATSLLVGNLLLVVANAAFYFVFRNVKPPEEAERVALDT